MLDLGLLPLALGDVGEGRDVIFRLTMTIPDQADRQPHRVLFATLASIVEFPLPGAALVQECPQVAVEAAILLASPQYHRLLTENLLFGVAGDPFEHLVDGDDAVASVGDQDGFVAGFKHSGRQTELVLQLLAATDVAQYQQDLIVVAGQESGFPADAVIVAGQGDFDGALALLLQDLLDFTLNHFGDQGAGVILHHGAGL